MNVLITGAAGFIGSELGKFLLNKTDLITELKEIVKFQKNYN